MQVTTKITVDLTRQNVGQRVNAVQGDGNTRLAEITLLCGGAPWTPPDGVEAAIAYMQPAGTKGLYNKLADGTAAISISGNVATVILAPQMLSVSGTVQASLVFNDAQLNRLTTFPFAVSVTSNPAAGAQKTEDYIRLQWLEDKLDEYLRKAADSGAFDGKPGDNGVTFTPSVSENGDLSWRNNGGLPNPQTVNIRGKQGDSTAATAAANAAQTSAANAETHAADAAASAAAAQATVGAMGTELNQIKDGLAGKVPKKDYAPETKTESMTQPVGKDENGKLWTAPGSGGAVDLTGYATEQWVQNQKYLTAVPDGYAKTTDIPKKPEDIGADPKGTAETAVSQHNTNTDAHNDIRLELKAINDKLTAFFDSDDQTLDELSEIVAYITSNKTMIEAITTSKVSVTDIIDNLTTNVSNKPLSAAQGVVLKGLIDTVSNSLANYQHKGDYALRSELPAVPTNVSAFSNDAGYLTAHQDISGKVDKVEGKGLSSNDYDNAAKAKVDAIPEDPMYTDTVYDDTEVKQGLNQLKDEIVELEHLILSIQGNIPGAEPLAEFSQMNPLVTKYMDEVTYDPTDYSSSAMLTYSYTETDYVKWHPSGYDLDLKDSGELHLADSVSHTMIPSVVGVNSLVNAIPDVVAHWWNSVDGNVKQSGTIKPTGQVRMIATTATNVRDIGGWVCDGGRVKYGKLFRGGLLDETDRPVLVDQLRIKHDLDLRSKADNDGATSSPLGNDVIYTVADNAVWYTLSGRDEEWSIILRTIFDAVAKNEPIIFHCAAGADRTGTVACILEAILGVSQSDVDKDFELTSFAISPNARRRIDDDWKNLIGEITAIPTGSTFRDKVVNWVGSLGFTNDDLNNFRKSMIDGSPADVVIEEIVTPPTETNLFDVSAAHLNCRIGSDGGIREGLDGSLVIDIDVTSINKLKIKGNLVVSSAYNYMGRMAFILSDETSIVGPWFTFDSQWTHDLTTRKEKYPTLSKMRYWFVLKDGVAITADDCSSIEITPVE
ncbi:MAG: tyrosine-protein phosphatase [Clostridiales bacterium]|nr:tyrosine-protein phosphatase [Clostridiales bacterium]